VSKRLPYQAELGWTANVLTIGAAALAILTLLELRRRRLLGHFDNDPQSTRASLLGAVL
jgi:hypothetical protein